MALFTPSESPAVVVREIDLTGGVPNVASTTGAYAGDFNWGPAKEVVSVSNEADLVANFATPSQDNAVDFLSATQFLKYSSSLQVVRIVDSTAKSAYSLQGVSALVQDSVNNPAYIISNPLIMNDEDFLNREPSLTAQQTQNDPVFVAMMEAANPPYQDSDGFGNPLFVFQTDADGNPLVDSSGNNIFELDSAGNQIPLMVDPWDPSMLQGLGYGFAARYVGEIGNSIKVSYLPADSDGTGFQAWSYSSSFDRAPQDTIHAQRNGLKNDEVHLVVVDEDGLITGTKGFVLETFGSLSINPAAKNTEGQSIYIKDVINQNSNFIHAINFDKELQTAVTNAQQSNDFGTATAAARNVSLQAGASSTNITTGDIMQGYDLFEDKDQVEIDFLIAPSANGSADQKQIVNDLVATAQGLRKDCIVTASPARNDIVGVLQDADKVTNAISTANGFTKSSYLVIDNNFLKVYDKFNDKYVFIPAASTTAGIMAATDYNRAPWFSPAGSRRGQLLGITSLAYSPTKAQRDSLYKASINPIANIPGQGALLFGDKTALGYPSAFDRINVRRLFLVLERAIGRAAEQVMFEFNDEFTRAEFVNIVEPVLREVQGRRGITDFRVVCDATNNTGAVIDRNEFKADIFIKPARSINYVTLSFVAVRSGVDFEEVVGTV